MAKLHPKLARTLLEEGIDPDSVFIAGEIECPQHVGREGYFLRKDRQIVPNVLNTSDFDKKHYGEVNRHVLARAMMCPEKATVFFIGTDPEGRKRYRSVCWRDPGDGALEPAHVHDMDERVFLEIKDAVKVDVLRVRH